jgi:hypothetical protein
LYGQSTGICKFCVQRIEGMTEPWNETATSMDFSPRQSVGNTHLIGGGILDADH